MSIALAPDFIDMIEQRNGWNWWALTPVARANAARYVLEEELCALYVHGMSDDEYFAAENWYWDNQRRMMLQFLPPADVHMQLLNARNDPFVTAGVGAHLNVLGVDAVPPVRHYPDPPMMVPEDTESENDEAWPVVVM